MKQVNSILKHTTGSLLWLMAFLYLALLTISVFGLKQPNLEPVQLSPLPVQQNSFRQENLDIVFFYDVNPYDDFNQPSNPDWIEPKYLPSDFSDVLTDELSDVECLALNIFWEARGESTLGKELVAQVTMNRVNKELWPDSVCSVVRERTQFSWTRDGRQDNPRLIPGEQWEGVNKEVWEESYRIAVSFVYGGYTVDLPDARLLTNFHSGEFPGWTNVVFVIQEAGHKFYRLRGTKYA